MCLSRRLIIRIDAYPAMKRFRTLDEDGKCCISMGSGRVVELYRNQVLKGWFILVQLWYFSSVQSYIQQTILYFPEILACVIPLPLEFDIRPYHLNPNLEDYSCQSQHEFWKSNF